MDQRRHTPQRPDTTRARRPYEPPSVVDFGDAEKLTQVISGAYV
jgi:hypothetical protein